MAEDADKERERLLSSPVRLRIMAALLAGEVVEFTALLEFLDLTRGNLSSHMKQLSEAGYVSIIKEFAGKKPRTTYEITEIGIREFEIYISILESIIGPLKKGVSP